MQAARIWLPLRSRLRKAFVDPAGYKEFVESTQRDFERALRRQSSQRQVSDRAIFDRAPLDRGHRIETWGTRRL